MAFEKGEAGAHVIHDPFDDPYKLVAIGWPPEGRYPVHQLEETADVYDGGRTANDP